MNRATPKTMQLARRVILFEIEGEKFAKSGTLDLLKSSKKLGPNLTALMGEAGFQSLLARSFALASGVVPWLRGGTLNAQGDLAGLEAVVKQLGPTVLLNVRVVLLAQLTGLLIAFIGENLALGLLQNVWPGVALNKSDATKEVTSEKAD